ncbi:hypothetical protein DL95DRAFT_55528 [Leptodontidium sp. 2 PMI_412]|nr:hypothetical protein DL95DRAFT_55528 [Leptodontidium sp. 2 PMI_412]
MNRDPSCQSNNSSWTEFSVGSNATIYSFATETYDFIQPEDFLQEFKQEAGIAYDPHYAAFGGQFNSRPSPVTEQANLFEGIHLDTYHPSSGHIISGVQQEDVLSMDYTKSFGDPSLTSEKLSPYGMNYRTQPTQSASRTNSRDNSSTLRPPAAHLPSNSQTSYVNDQPGEKHTPKSLGWPPNTELVKKYKLILQKDNLHLEILKMLDISFNTPERVYLDIPASTQKGSTQCPWPGECNRNGVPFTRPADGDRHLKHVHGPPEDRDKFPCSYCPCLSGRHQEPFTRKDHYRDHLRDFHQEDIGAAKGEKGARTDKQKRDWARQQKKWLNSRKIGLYLGTFQTMALPPDNPQCQVCEPWHCGNCGFFELRLSANCDCPISNVKCFNEESDETYSYSPYRACDKDWQIFDNSIIDSDFFSHSDLVWSNSTCCQLNLQSTEESGNHDSLWSRLNLEKMI